MKTTIKISGQIGGNFELLRKLGGKYREKKNGMFNSFFLYYDSKSEAQQDLAECWKRLKEDYYPEKVSGDVYRDKGNRVCKVLYDASRAEIVEA